MTSSPPFAVTSASIGRRVGAFAIDLAIACGLAVVLFGILAAVLAGVGASNDPMAFLLTLVVGYLLVGLVLLVWWLAYSAMQGGSGSIGQRALGLSLGDAVTGAPIGFWRAVLRNLVWGLAGSIVVGYFTPLFDSSARRQGWHDMAAKAVVKDRRRTDAVPAPFAELAANPYLAQPHAPAPAAAAHASAASAYAPTAPVSTPVPAPGYAPSYAAAAPAYVPAASAYEPAGEDAFGEATVVVRRTAAAVPAGVVSGMPATSHAVAGDFPGLTMPFPAATTTEPLVAATAFAGTGSAADDDLDVTRLTGGGGVGTVPPPAQRAALYDDAPVLAVLTWDDGTRMAVYGRTLYGRNPAMEPGAVAIAVRDETLSLSKTHFEIGGDANGAWVVDRHSTNGTVLIRDGGRIPLVPGLQTSLRAGDRLEFGDRTAAVGGA